MQESSTFYLFFFPLHGSCRLIFLLPFLKSCLALSTTLQSYSCIEVTYGKTGKAAMITPEANFFTDG